MVSDFLSFVPFQTLKRTSQNSRELILTGFKASFRGVTERVKGIEPSCAAWEAAVLPLNYTRGEIFDFRYAIADCNRNKMYRSESSSATAVVCAILSASGGDAPHSSLMTADSTAANTQTLLPGNHVVGIRVDVRITVAPQYLVCSQRPANYANR